MPTEAKTTDRSKSDSREGPEFDYKDVKTLQRYLNPFGQIEARHRTGLSAKQQRQLARAVKRARHLGLLPFTVK